LLIDTELGSSFQGINTIHFLLQHSAAVVQIDSKSIGIGQKFSGDPRNSAEHLLKTAPAMALNRGIFGMGHSKNAIVNLLLISDCLLIRNLIPYPPPGVVMALGLAKLVMLIGRHVSDQNTKSGQAINEITQETSIFIDNNFNGKSKWEKPHDLKRLENMAWGPAGNAFDNMEIGTFAHKSQHRPGLAGNVKTMEHITNNFFPKLTKEPGDLAGSVPGEMGMPLARTALERTCRQQGGRRCSLVGEKSHKFTLGGVSQIDVHPGDGRPNWERDLVLGKAFKTNLGT